MSYREGPSLARWGKRERCALYVSICLSLLDSCGTSNGCRFAAIKFPDLGLTFEAESQEWARIGGEDQDHQRARGELVVSFGKILLW
jgi:hypothetical protein